MMGIQGLAWKGCVHEGLYTVESGEPSGYASGSRRELGSSTGAYLCEPMNMQTAGGLFTNDQSWTHRVTCVGVLVL